MSRNRGLWNEGRPLAEAARFEKSPPIATPIDRRVAGIAVALAALLMWLLIG